MDTKMVKLTNAKIIAIYRGLSVLGKLPGVKFAYVITRNKNALHEHVVAMDAANPAIDPAEEYKAYDAARVRYAEEYADKDEKGNPVQHFDDKGRAVSFQILKRAAGFQNILNALGKEHKEALDTFKTMADIYNDLLEAEVEIDFLTLAYDELPEKIDGEGIDAVIDFVTEPATTEAAAAK